MFYAKHPVLGNKHFESVDRAAMEADGWVFFPHGSGMPDYLPSESPEPSPGPEKRKPGRPKRVSPV